MEVLKGRDYVQVRPRDVNKGVFVTEVLRLLRRAGNDVELVIAMGDDTTDESMFDAAQAFAKEKPGQRECVGLRGREDADYVHHWQQAVAGAVLRDGCVERA